MTLERLGQTTVKKTDRKGEGGNGEGQVTDVSSVMVEHFTHGQIRRGNESWKVTKG